MRASYDCVSNTNGTLKKALEQTSPLLPMSKGRLSASQEHSVIIDNE